MGNFLINCNKKKLITSKVGACSVINFGVLRNISSSITYTVEPNTVNMSKSKVPLFQKIQPSTINKSYLELKDVSKYKVTAFYSKKKMCLKNID